jgi:hypothetical protein
LEIHEDVEPEIKVEADDIKGRIGAQLESEDKFHRVFETVNMTGSLENLDSSQSSK